MKDRIPTYPGRVRLIPVDGQTNVFDLERADEPTEPGTPLSKANLLSDATAALYGLGENATPDSAFDAASKLFGKNLINILHLKLQASLSSSDIDAWADLLDDTSLLNLSESNDKISVSSGVLNVDHVIQQTTQNADYTLGMSDYIKVKQTFTATSSSELLSVTIKIARYGNPTDSVSMKLYDANANNLIATSITYVSGQSLLTSGTDCTFLFQEAPLVSGTKYSIVIERTGALDSSNAYNLRISNTDLYPECSVAHWTGISWNINPGYDLYFVISQNQTGIAVWNPVTATEALSKLAVVADQAEGAGTITWYISEDGVTWTEITSLDEMQSVGFTTTSVYLKCVLTGGATVDSVAWGGY